MQPPDSQPSVPDLSDYENLSHLASPLALGPHVIPNFRQRAHQKVISDAIVDAITKRGPRFIAVSIAQQMGKSQLTSFLTPMWWQELHAYGIVPGGLVGLISYEDSLPMTWSTNIRRTIQQNPGGFATELRKDSKAAGYWETEAGGGLLAIGIGGPIQGRPISLLVVDDIFKSSEQASSEKHRETIWSWWNGVAFGRLQPWTIVLVVGVRFREDDFIGRLMSPEYEGNPEHWRYIRIPVVADSENDPLGRPIGDALIRPQVDQTQEEANAEMEFVRSSISTYSWSTLWQQNPVDPEGTIFFEKSWRYWGGDSGNKLPKPDEFDQLFFSWDMTYKDKKENDWVVGQLWGGKNADRYLIDQVRGHWGFMETCARVRSFAEKHRSTYAKATGVLVEGKANGPAVIDALREKVGGLIDFDPREYGDKTQRMWACQPLLLGGNLYAPAPSEYPWVRDFTRECGDFPRAAHDDMCFVAGTMVATPAGDRPIESLRPGDRVLTPRGISRVKSCGITGVQPVVTRHGLTGTFNHPVFDDSDGRFDALTQVLLPSRLTYNSWRTWRTQTRFINPKLFPSEELSIGSWGRGAITSARVAATKVARGRRDSMSPSGKPLTRKGSPKVSLSTISTAIRSITTRLIFSGYLASNMMRSREFNLIQKLSSVTWRRFVRLLLSGIAQKKAEPGIVNMLVSSATEGNRNLVAAKSARKPFPRKIRPSSVVLLAGIGIDETQDTTTLKPLAFSVDRVTGTEGPLIGREQRNSALVPVLSDGERREYSSSSAHASNVESPSSPSKKRPGSAPLAATGNFATVYNLTVEPDGCYYANGILVSNCDAMTQALLWMQKYKSSPSTLITATSTDLHNVRALGGFTRRM